MSSASLVSKEVLKPTFTSGATKTSVVADSKAPLAVIHPKNCIDKANPHPQCAAEYADDIYHFLRQQEDSMPSDSSYMNIQPDINENMRAILIDWLVAVHSYFVKKNRFSADTLYLTVDILDRFLAKTDVSKSKLQLVGVTAFFIASKYEEIYPPFLEELVKICENAYSSKQIEDTEEVILKTLSYQVSKPTAHKFLVRFLQVSNANKMKGHIANYVLDGSLLHHSLLKYRPSQLAAAAVFIANKVSGDDSWNSTLAFYTDYTQRDIMVVAQAIQNEQANKLECLLGVENKYAGPKYGSVSKWFHLNLSLA